MNILITNDDGFDFPGITILQKKLSTLWKTIIIAPKKESSGTGQAITLFEPIRVSKVSDLVYSVEGYPSDCVNIGLSSNLYPEKIDLVVSGINKGVNMGADIWYSGTVAGARHAFIHGCSGLAVSCGHSRLDDDYDKVADFTLNFIQKYILSAKSPTFFNINYPTQRDVKGLQWSYLGRRTYKDTYILDKSQGNESLYQFKCLELGYLPQKGSDFDVYNKGYISATPLYLDATDYEKLAEKTSHHT